MKTDDKKQPHLSKGNLCEDGKSILEPNSPYLPISEGLPNYQRLCLRKGGPRRWEEMLPVIPSGGPHQITIPSKDSKWYIIVNKDHPQETPVSEGLPNPQRLCLWDEGHRRWEVQSPRAMLPDIPSGSLTESGLQMFGICSPYKVSVKKSKTIMKQASILSEIS